MPSVVKPFSATYYNPMLVKNYSNVICPPYDVINKEELKALRRKSEYNFSRVLIADNKNYKKSAVTLNNWVKDKVLIDDPLRCFYLYEQKFRVDGRDFTRFGILGLLRMDKKGIFPHEHTLPAPKVDRKKIIRATKSNLSPIFVIAAKKMKSFHQLYKSYCNKKEFFKFKDGQANINRIWRIHKKADIDKLSRGIAKCKLVIADGHHRFEISYDYFRKNKGKFRDLNFILAYITDCQKGLNVLPTHRVVKLKIPLSQVLKKLDDLFFISEASRQSIESMLKSKGKFSFGICNGGKFYSLSLKKYSSLNKIPDKIYKQLDTYVFHHLVLPLLKIDGPIEYTHNLSEAKKMAGSGKAAFLLKAVSLDEVLRISSKGFKLPQKSTYFYPKVLSGVAIRRFVK